MDMLVATAHDFALLRRGRPIASGRWDDVQQAHASVDGPPHGPSDGARCLVLRLRDAEFRARDDAPGWDDFVDAAEAALPGMRPRRAWESDLPANASGPPLLVFDRLASHR